jgi:hypothetical protein
VSDLEIEKRSPLSLHLASPTLSDRNSSELLLAKQSLTLDNERLTRKTQLLEQDLSSLQAASLDTRPTSSSSASMCSGHLETIDRLESEARGLKMKITNLEVSLSLSPSSPPVPFCL